MTSSSDYQPEKPETTEAEPAKTSETIESHTNYDMKPLVSGQIVSGLVVHLDDQGALVDVGMKSEGMIPQSEMGERTTLEGKPLAVGERIDVFVMKSEDDDGAAILSKKRADYEGLWKKLIQAHENGEILGAMVTERVRGGLVVDLGVRAFLPASQVNVRNIQALDGMVGRAIKLKILEVDRERKRVVVSQKQAAEEVREKKRSSTLASLQEGQIRKGLVRRLTDYGAFVDLGGVDGLLHITEMSWSYLSHPQEVLKVGEQIEVMVLKIDNEKGRISLGLKQILPDPWDEVGQKYHVGSTAFGRVTRIVPMGAFVRLPEGVEAIIPTSELADDRKVKAEEVLQVGQELEAKVIALRPQERRMTLSLRQAHSEAESQRVREYISRQADSNRVTIGDILGDALTKGLAEAGAKAPEAETEEAEVPEASSAE